MHDNVWKTREDVSSDEDCQSAGLKITVEDMRREGSWLHEVRRTSGDECRGLVVEIVCHHDEVHIGMQQGSIGGVV
jgi:hypothetical protein